MGDDKTPILIFRANKNVDLVYKKTKEDAVHIKKDYSALFSPENIFSLKVYARGFWAFIKNRTRKRFPCLVLIDGKQTCETLRENDLFDPLTNEETREIVKRNMALGMKQFQPIALKIALIIIILQIIVIIMMIAVMGRARMF